MYLKIKVFLSFWWWLLFSVVYFWTGIMFTNMSWYQYKTEKDLEWKENLPLFLAAQAGDAGWCPSALLPPPAGPRLPFSRETWRLYSGKNELFLKQFLKGDGCFSFLIFKNCTLLLNVKNEKICRIRKCGKYMEEMKAMTQIWGCFFYFTYGAIDPVFLHFGSNCVFFLILF